MKFYFVILALLNFLDMSFTAFGLKSEFISEANPLMSYLWGQSPYLFIVVKSFFSIILLAMAFYFIPQEKNRWKWHIAFGTTTGAYTIVTLLHFGWIALFFASN